MTNTNPSHNESSYHLRGDRSGHLQPDGIVSGIKTTRVRYGIVSVSVAMAFSLYLDRVCIGEIVKSNGFLHDTQLSKDQIGQILGAFFLTYALCQVPSGWLSDRFGARRTLTVSILAWSVFTAISGITTSFLGLLIARLACGVAQAGAYPTSSGIIRRWIRPTERGRASSAISFGGRLGATLAPLLTSILIVALGNWRPALFLYGFLGIFIAALYWWIVRDRPTDHPNCNAAEQKWIGTPEDSRTPTLRELPPLLGACIKSRSLWLNSLEQFCVNVGWAFLVTWLPTYLKESGGLSPRTGGLVVTIVLAMGMVGQLIGGWATDWSVRRFGLRWGRVLPISLSCAIASLAYLGCLKFESVAAIVLFCAVVSMMTDIGNPSVWAFMQDVGGRSTGAIYGWANMWGNLGASASAIMVPWMLKQGAADASGQTRVFLACAAAFLLGSLAALGMDATRPLVLADDGISTQKPTT